MSKYEIEKGVPLRSRRHEEYPWADMEVGDSFVVGVPEGVPKQPVRSQVHQSAAYYRRSTGKSLRTAIRDIGDGRLRVWRVEDD